MILRKEVKARYFLVSESDPAFLVAGIGFNHNREHICSSIFALGDFQLSSRSAQSQFQELRITSNKLLLQALHLSGQSCL